MPRPGDILLVRSKGFYGWAIRQAAGGHFNHAAIFVSPDEIIEADVARGVCLSDAKSHVEQGSEVQIATVIGASADDGLRAADEAERLLDAKYDIVGIAGIWGRFIGKRLGIAPKVNPTNAPSNWFCSELVAWCWHEVGVDLVSGSPPSLVAPSEIWESPLIRGLNA